MLRGNYSPSCFPGGAVAVGANTATGVDLPAYRHLLLPGESMRRRNGSRWNARRYYRCSYCLCSALDTACCRSCASPVLRSTCSKHGRGRQCYQNHPSNWIQLRDLDVVIWRLSKSKRLDIVSGMFLRAIKIQCWLHRRLVRLYRLRYSQIDALKKVVVIESGAWRAARREGHRVVVFAGFDGTCKRMRQIS